MSLGSPVPAACGPGALLLKDVEGTPEEQSDSAVSAAVPGQTLRQAEVMII